MVSVVVFFVSGATAALLVVALAGLVVLEPVEHVLALDLAEGAEMGGDHLDLVGARRPEPGPEQIRQHLHLLGRRVPAAALGAGPRRAKPARLRRPLSLAHSSVLSHPLLAFSLPSDL